MAKTELKTKQNKASVTEFLNSIKEEGRRKDCFTIVKMMQKATGDKPKMWGTSIIGFGDVQMKYESGRELDWFKCGFSSRKASLAFYGLNKNSKQDLLKKLGKYKEGKGCLYINSLADIDLKVLKKIMEGWEDSMKNIFKEYKRKVVTKK